MPAWVDDFAVAVASGLVVALVGFVAAHVWGLFAKPAPRKVSTAPESGLAPRSEPELSPAEKLLWDEIQRNPSQEREEFYLSTFPAGRHAPEIERKLWALAEATGDIESYHRFGSVAPDGVHSGVAKLRLEQLKKTRLLRVFETAPGADVWSVALSPDGTLAAATCSEGGVIWEAGTGREVCRFGEITNSRHPSASIAFSPDGTELFLWNSLGKRIEVMDIRTGEVLRSIPTADYDISSMVFSRDGKRALGFGCHEVHHYWEKCVEGALVIWQISSGAAKSWTCHDDSVISANFLEVFGQIVSVSAGKPHIAITEPGKALLQRLPHLGGGVTSAFGRKSAFALACDTENDGLGRTRHSVIKLFQVDPLKPLKEVGELRGYPGYIRCMCVSQDDRLLAAGGDAGIVKVWSVADRREVATLAGHEAFTLAISFSRDGKRTITGGTDGKARLWDLTALDMSN